MDLKDLENAGWQVYFDLMRTIKSNLAYLLCATLLAIFGTDASAQSKSESTDFARYAMKLPENTLVKIQPKVTILRPNNRLSGSGARSRFVFEREETVWVPARGISLEARYHHNNLLGR